MANRARRSVGGGVLIDFIKLAAVVLAPAVPQAKSRVASPKSHVIVTEKPFFIRSLRFVKNREALKAERWDLRIGARDLHYLEQRSA